MVEVAFGFFSLLGFFFSFFGLIFFLAYSSKVQIMMEKPRWQKLEAGDDITSIIGKWKAKSACSVVLSFLCLIQFREWSHPKLRWVLPR